jgi:hypothetical protein
VLRDVIDENRVKCALASLRICSFLGCGHQTTAVGICKRENNFFIADVVQYINQISDIKPNVQRIFAVIDFQFFFGFFLLGVGADQF